MFEVFKDWSRIDTPGFCEGLPDLNLVYWWLAKVYLLLMESILRSSFSWTICATFGGFPFLGAYFRVLTAD
jgi:hypothetical protein